MAANPQQPLVSGYEATDASPRRLVYFFLILGGALVLMAFAMKWTFDYFTRAQNPGVAVSNPFTAARPLPSAPRVQAHPGQDIQLYLQSQQEILNSYGWVDRPNGIARIPIDRAMDLLLKKGLPTRVSGGSARQGSAQ